MSNNKPKILLIGGGGHCKSVIDVIEQEGKFEIAGIVEKFAGESKEVLAYPLIGSDDELAELRKEYKYAIITIGHMKSNAIRVKLFHILKELDFTLPVIVSPLAYLSKHTEVAEGTVLLHHALVNAGAKVGKNCIINSKALIEHDAIIEEHTHISTAAVVNGGTRVKANTFYGSNATSKESVEVEGFVKAGSVVK